MRSKWGSDKGTMLLINASTETVQNIVAGYDDVEIACLNAPSSHVVVGTEGAILEVETRLRTDSQYQGIQSQRLNVTHGFHSRFTEPLLADLSGTANSLVFHQPTIPLESCTSKALDHLAPDRVAQHTREPVFFYHAVRRLEQRLGSCVWLESGFDSPIVSMTKRAVECPEKHKFLDLRSSGRESVTATLAAVTVDLWRSGATSSFWAFHPLQKTKTTQIWLPPYQFDRTTHWMPYTDHALEMSRVQASASNSEPSVDTSSKPPRLVELCAKPNEPGQYTMNTQAQRYVDIVSGHVVCSRPLCPAAMYMERAIAAAQLKLGSIEGQAPWFENLTFEGPLGIDTDRDTTILLREDGKKPGWSFTAQSVSKTDPKRKPVLHAKGDFGFTPKTQLHRYQRLVTDRMKHLHNSETETLRSKRAYGLFSRIVRYAELLKGISSITLGESEASAVIDVPIGANTKDSEATGLCDTVAIDAFIQVVGLLINSSDQCASDEVYVATGVENFSMSLNCNFDRCKTWTVLAMFTPTDNSKAMGDVFILTRDGILVMTIMGVQFTKLPITRLEKLLDSANPKPRERPTVVPVQQAPLALSSSNSSLDRSQDESEEDSLSSPISNGTSIDSEPEASADDSAVKKLKALIASYVGIDEQDILDESNVADLGVDSLAATELADEISNDFSKEVDGGELPMMKLGELCQLVAPRATAKPTKIKPITQPTVKGDGTALTSQPSQIAAETKQSIPPEPSARPTRTVSDMTVLKSDPVEVLRQCDSMFQASADRLGFLDYWSAVAPKQNELVLAYVGEEFKKLDIDLWSVQPGATLPNIEHLPKHARVVQRLWDILADHGIIYNYESTRVRSSKPLPTKTSTTLLNELNELFPHYANENKLMSVTAPYFAEGLKGNIDHIGLLFGNQRGQNCLNDFYNNSPQLAVMTDHLINFFSKLMKETSLDGPLRILEVGGGFGGTTKRLAETLEKSGRPVEYTFTDISSMLVKEAKKKFSQYTWMDFQSLNLEKDISASLQGSYDIVIGTNVVHATFEHRPVHKANAQFTKERRLHCAVRSHSYCGLV